MHESITITQWEQDEDEEDEEEEENWRVKTRRLSPDLEISLFQKNTFLLFLHMWSTGYKL